MTRTNFTMTPNIVFDVLTNEFDIVGYQKLMRLVGIGNQWRGGVRALAEKLNMSLGRVVKLRNILEQVGFIEITKGDNKHGESDTWFLVDIWELNNTCSLNEHPCSPNETGQEMEESENVLNAEIIDDRPVHETEQTCSRNGTATCSRNGTHKNKIFIKEDIKKLEEPIGSFVRLSANDLELRKAIALKLGSKPKVSAVTPEEWQRIVELFEFWKTAFGKNSNTRLTTERGRAVLDRLRSFQNFTDEEIQFAILGCKESPNHNGTKGTVYDDLELICRTDDQIARMIGYYEVSPTAKTEKPDIPEWQKAINNCHLCDEKGSILTNGKHEVCKHQ